MPAKTVLAMAKSAGISLSKTYLYLLRGSSKSAEAPKPKQAVVAASKAAQAGPSTGASVSSTSSSPSGKRIGTRASTVAGQAKVAEVKRTRAPTPKTKTTGNGASVARPITTPSSAEDLLRAVAAEIGLARAVEILAEQRAILRQVIGG